MANYRKTKNRSYSGEKMEKHYSRKDFNNQVRRLKREVEQ